MNSNRMTVLLLGVLTILTPGCSDSARSISTPDVSTYRDDVEHHFELGFTLQNIGDLQGAIAEYRAALRLNPSHASAHYNLGVVLQSKRDLEGAVAEYRAALRLNPNDLNAHTNLGVALQTTGDLEGAIAEYHTALRLDPNHANAHYNLGVVLQDIGEPTEAAKEFRESLRLIPESLANRGKISQVKEKLSEIGLGETRCDDRLVELTGCKKR